MPNYTLKLQQIDELLKELNDKKASLLEDENSLEEEARANPEEFYVDEYKVEALGICLYEIEKCEKSISVLEKKREKLLAKINVKKR